MRNLLTELCLEAEAHTMMAMYMASLYQQSQAKNGESSSHDHTDTAREVFRIGVSISKYYITKRLPNFTYECMEVIIVH